MVNSDLKISKYLYVRDLIKSSTAAKYRIDNRLPDKYLENAKLVASLYDRIYDHFKGNIVINSCFRSWALNNKIGGSTSSQHMKCLALDIDGINGVTNAEIFAWCKDNLQFSQLIWEFGTKHNPAWVHIGYGTAKNILRAVKTGTKTYYQTF